jgi:hypothetical protein
MNDIEEIIFEQKHFDKALQQLETNERQTFMNLDLATAADHSFFLAAETHKIPVNCLHIASVYSDLSLSQPAPAQNLKVQSIQIENPSFEFLSDTLLA